MFSISIPVMQYLTQVCLHSLDSYNVSLVSQLVSRESDLVDMIIFRMLSLVLLYTCMVGENEKKCHKGSDYIVKCRWRGIELGLVH